MQSVLRKLSALRRNDRGNVAVIFALTMVPVAVLSGGSVDFGRVLSERAKLQAATDAAAIAAMRVLDASASERVETATKVFNANISSAHLSGVAPTITPSGNSIKVAAATAVSTPFLGLVNIPSLTASAESTATGSGNPTSEVVPGKICLLALDPGSPDGIHLQGDNHVNYIDCWAHTNSTLGTAINANGSNAKAYGKGHCAVGGWTQTHDTFQPTPTSNCRPVADPYASMAGPSKAVTCKAQNLNLKKGTFTLDPGRYCGGINIQAHATVTFNPGLYYIDNGEFNVQSGASVTGSNVLFYLEGAASKFTVIGGGTVNLSGRKTGWSYQGFLIMGHPNANPGGESNIQGGGTFKMEGTVYMPTQRIEVSGNGDVNNATVSVFGMVAKDFYFRGNGVFNMKKHGGSGLLPDIMPTMPSDAVQKTVLN